MLEPSHVILFAANHVIHRDTSHLTYLLSLDFVLESNGEAPATMDDEAVASRLYSGKSGGMLNEDLRLLRKMNEEFKYRVYSIVSRGLCFFLIISCGLH